MSSDDRETDERVADLVEQVLEQRASGAAPDLLAMAGGDDALCRRLEQALEDLEALPAMFGAVGGDDAWLGRILGERFELVERIGAGAMGMVYRANDRVLGRDVAVKLLWSFLGVLAKRLRNTSRELGEAREALAAEELPAELLGEPTKRVDKSEIAAAEEAGEGDSDADEG